jgi:putative transposase
VARQARLAIAGVPHLVEHRAAARALFGDAEEGRRLLQALHDAARDCELALHGYALTPGALWLIATPGAAGALGRAMQAVGRRYVRWLNDRRAQSGALFAGRYRAAPLEAERELLPALRYVETRPVAAALAVAPPLYPWSSSAHHVGLAVDGQLQPHPVYWALGNTPFERQAAWRALLDAGAAQQEIARYERALAGGWLVGSREFEKSVAALAPRRLRPSRPGRPRRRAVEAAA